MEKESSGAFSGLFTALWEVWKAMWAQFMEIAPMVFKFVIWVLCGIVILPCVFVAGSLYEPWVKWGEKM